MIDPFEVATSGQVLSMKLVRTVARRVRCGRPPHEADVDGSVEDDLVQDLATRLWEVRVRRPDVGTGYLRQTLYRAAAESSRRLKRVGHYRRLAESDAAEGRWWARDTGLEDGASRMEARDLLSLAPQWLVDKVLASQRAPRPEGAAAQRAAMGGV